MVLNLNKFRSLLSICIFYLSMYMHITFPMWIDQIKKVDWAYCYVWYCPIRWRRSRWGEQVQRKLQGRFSSRRFFMKESYEITSEVPRPPLSSFRSLPHTANISVKHPIPPHISCIFFSPLSLRIQGNDCNSLCCMLREIYEEIECIPVECGTVGTSANCSISVAERSMVLCWTHVSDCWFDAIIVGL